MRVKKSLLFLGSRRWALSKTRVQMTRSEVRVPQGTDQIRTESRDPELVMGRGQWVGLCLSGRSVSCRPWSFCHRDCPCPTGSPVLLYTFSPIGPLPDTPRLGTGFRRTVPTVVTVDEEADGRRVSITHPCLGPELPLPRRRRHVHPVRTLPCPLHRV